MSNPLVIFPYNRIQGIHRVEVARLTENNGLINIVLKYDPPGMLSPSINANGIYHRDTKKFELKNFSAYSGNQQMRTEDIRRRIRDLEKVLQDKEIIAYLTRI